MRFSHRFISLSNPLVLLVLPILLAASGFVQASDCSYSFIIPSGSATWRVETSQVISWNKIGECSNKVDLKLLRDGREVSGVASGIQNTGSYTWNIPSSVDPARDYSIRIRDRDDSSSTATSAEITITDISGCTVEVTKPVAGDQLYKEEEIVVRWNTRGSCNYSVRLDLYRSGGYVLKISEEERNDGEWTGVIPGEFATGSGYTIRVSDFGNNSIRDDSGSFSISPARPCSINISSPSDESTWYPGETYELQWSSTGACSSTLLIDLMKADQRILSISQGAQNSGRFQWTIPDDLSSGDDYRIRITDSTDEQSKGFSEYFSIVDDSGPAHIYWIDNVARSEGAEGSVWRSDLVLFNPGDEDATIELWFFSSTGAHPLESTIRFGTQSIFEDVVGLIGVEGKGCLGIASDQPLELSGRIYNLTQDGTFGQFLQGWEDGHGLKAGQSGRLLQLRQYSGRYRTNISVTNTSTEPADVLIDLFDSAGNLLKSYSLQPGPRELIQDLEPFRKRAGRPDLGWGFALVSVDEGEGILVSASVIDSRTNDATTVLFPMD